VGLFRLVAGLPRRSAKPQHGARCGSRRRLSGAGSAAAWGRRTSSKIRAEPSSFVLCGAFGAARLLIGGKADRPRCELAVDLTHRSRDVWMLSGRLGDADCRHSAPSALPVRQILGRGLGLTRVRITGYYPSTITLCVLRWMKESFIRCNRCRVPGRATAAGTSVWCGQSSIRRHKRHFRACDQPGRLGQGLTREQRRVLHRMQPAAVGARWSSGTRNCSTARGRAVRVPGVRAGARPSCPGARRGARR
jgi:hypothetical protein